MTVSSFHQGRLRPLNTCRSLNTLLVRLKRLCNPLLASYNIRPLPLSLSLLPLSLSDCASREEQRAERQRSLASMREHSYAVFALFLAPAACFCLMPAELLGPTYLLAVLAFISVCSWVTLESVSACFARLKPHPVQHQHYLPVAYIVAAYLNNEADILDDTLEAYLQLEYRGSIQVLVVYNVKGTSIPQEAGLLQRWHGKQAGNICISMVRNFSSSSKAENVNYGLRLLAEDPPEYIAVMDADHQVGPWGRWLMRISACDRNRFHNNCSLGQTQRQGRSIRCFAQGMTLYKGTVPSGM